MVEGLKQHREIETFNGKRAITPLAGTITLQDFTRNL